MDEILELQSKLQQLEQSLKMLRKTGNELACAERDYKMALSKEILRLRTENYPATLIANIVYGLDNIATLRFKRDCAEVVYKANLEAINVYKLEAKVLQNQIEREWDNG